MPRVELHNVSKAFRDQRGGSVMALRGLSLEVEAGECVVLLGPSGCGKTTALRLIAGLEEPDGGSIHIAEQTMAGVPPQDRDVAMVFQHFALYPHLTVAENLTLGLKLRHVSSTDIGQQLRETADTLGLGPVLERFPKELSGGERQRVAIGRAIIRRPQVLLFDEPLSNLDAPLRAQLRSDIAALHQRSAATLLYVTHDQTEAMALAGRLAVLNEGRVQQFADPATIYLQPANVFVAGFVGTPPMNLWRGTLRRTDAGRMFQPASGSGPGWSLQQAPSRWAMHEGECVLGLRPENLQLSSGDSALHGTVTSVERLGSETILRLLVDGVPVAMAMRVPANAVPKRDDLVNLAANWEAACCFHPQTGQAL